MKKILLLAALATAISSITAYKGFALPDDATKLQLSLVSSEDIQNLVRRAIEKTNRYYYDASTETCFRIVHTNDFIVCYAVTNIDLTASANVEALNWMEENWQSIVYPVQVPETDNNDDDSSSGTNVVVTVTE